MWIRAISPPTSRIVIFMGTDPTRTLVISQVVLSFGLPFAVIPLIQFSRRPDLMGELVKRRPRLISKKSERSFFQTAA
jgi:manganese transport protein